MIGHFNRRKHLKSNIKNPILSNQFDSKTKKSFSKDNKESLDDIALDEIKQLCANLEKSRLSTKKSFEADIEKILGLLSDFVTFFGGKRAGIEDN